MKPLEEKVTPAEVTWNLASQACARGREQGIISEGLEGQKWRGGAQGRCLLGSEPHLWVQEEPFLPRDLQTSRLSPWAA